MYLIRLKCCSFILGVTKFRYTQYTLHLHNSEPNSIYNTPLVFFGVNFYNLLCPLLIAHSLIFRCPTFKTSVPKLYIFWSPFWIFLCTPDCASIAVSKLALMKIKFFFLALKNKFTMLQWNMAFFHIYFLLWYTF